MISVDDASGVLWLFSSMQLQGVEDAKLDKARDFFKLNCSKLVDPISLYSSNLTHVFPIPSLPPLLSTGPPDERPRPGAGNAPAKQLQSCLAHTVVMIGLCGKEQ
jgi:hypothetical protein